MTVGEDFHMIKLTDHRSNPVWVNVRQICAIKCGPFSNAEIHLPGQTPFQCTESVSEVMQRIVDALNGVIAEEPADG